MAINGGAEPGDQAKVAVLGISRRRTMAVGSCDAGAPNGGGENVEETVDAGITRGGQSWRSSSTKAGKTVDVRVQKVEYV